MKKYLKLIIVFLFVTTNLFSQTDKKFIDSGSVENQFESLINNSNKYQDYKVVKHNWLLKLKSNVTDSLQVSKDEILNSTRIINSQKNTIDSINIALTEIKTDITKLKSQIESISFLGIEFEKGLFKTIMFSTS